MHKRRSRAATGLARRTRNHLSGKFREYIDQICSLTRSLARLARVQPHSCLDSRVPTCCSHVSVCSYIDICRVQASGPAQDLLDLLSYLDLIFLANALSASRSVPSQSRTRVCTVAVHLAVGRGRIEPLARSISLSLSLPRPSFSL